MARGPVESEGFTWVHDVIRPDGGIVLRRGVHGSSLLSTCRLVLLEDLGRVGIVVAGEVNSVRSSLEMDGMGSGGGICDACRCCGGASSEDCEDTALSSWVSRAADGPRTSISISASPTCPASMESMPTG